MYRLSVNLTEDEKLLLDEAVKQSGLKISSYVKKNILCEAPKTAGSDMLPILSDITTNMNIFQSTYDFSETSDDHFIKIRKGIEQLWQTL